MTNLILYARPGWGSVLTEAQLVWYGIPFDFRAVGDLFADPAARQELETINPLGQIPTLILADGRVMTESAAITLWLADQTGRSDLVPEPDAAERAQFLRWLIFITSNIYPVYTYTDDPARFVPDEAARQGFADTVHRYARKLFGMLEEGAAATPWFLGRRFSALDIYICTLVHWDVPGRAWIDVNAPTLAAIADATEALPQLTAVWTRNFPGS